MTSPLIPDRSCGDCTLCCTFLGISALQKPPGLECPHCLTGKGCGVYAQRPRECATFHCAWRLWPALGPHWYPALSRLMVVVVPEARRVMVTVDPAVPDMWKRAPYYDELKSMSKAMMPAGFQIGVQIGGALTVVLPDRDVELGHLGANDDVVFSKRDTPNGPQFDVHKRRL